MPNNDVLMLKPSNVKHNVPLRTLLLKILSDAVNISKKVSVTWTCLKLVVYGINKYVNCQFFIS